MLTEMVTVMAAGGDGPPGDVGVRERGRERQRETEGEREVPPSSFSSRVRHSNVFRSAAGAKTQQYATMWCSLEKKDR